MFFSELTVAEQPLLTVVPDTQAQLPVESRASEGIDYAPKLSLESSLEVSDSGSLSIGPFGRIAQAIWILDQVLSSFKTSQLDMRLAEIAGLHTKIQELLALLLQQGQSQGVVLCEAIAVTLRSVRFHCTLWPGRNR